MLLKTKLQLLLKRGKSHSCKYPLLTAVTEAAVIDAIIDTGTFIGDITDITDITIYL